jgi:hypothetical protein
VSIDIDELNRCLESSLRKFRTKEELPFEVGFGKKMGQFQKKAGSFTSAFFEN